MQRNTTLRIDDHTRARMNKLREKHAKNKFNVASVTIADIHRSALLAGLDVLEGYGGTSAPPQSVATHGRAPPAIVRRPVVRPEPATPEEELAQRREDRQEELRGMILNPPAPGVADLAREELRTVYGVELPEIVRPLEENRTQKN